MLLRNLVIPVEGRTPPRCAKIDAKSEVRSRAARITSCEKNERELSSKELLREMSDPVSRDVGRRLRAIRRQQGLSLDDVEERSGGKWSSSAIGAYERGYRTLTVERLRALADFYGVPISILLAPAPKRDGETEKVVIDLVALEQAGEDLEPLQRLVHSIQMQRGDFNGKILTIRGADIRNLSLLCGVTDVEMLEKLSASGVAMNLDDSLEDSIEEPVPESDGARGDSSP